jgi:hypothetical protein
MSSSSRKARRAWAAARKRHLRRGRVYHLEFQHDPRCPIYGPTRVCCCDATRVLRDDIGRVLARVEGAGPYDPLELVEVTP